MTGTLDRAEVAVASVDDAESLLAAATRLQVGDGDLQAGRHWFDMAYRAAEQAGDAQAMANAVLGLGGLWVHEHRTTAASELLNARLRHALSLVDPQTSLALRLRARLAGEADYRTGEHAAILAVLDEARRTADPVARAEALSLAHHCVLGPDHGERRRELAAELIGESLRTGRRSDLLMGLLWHTVDLFLAADPHAQRRLGELRELLARSDHLAVGFVASAIEVMLTIRAGKLDEAEALAQACAERGIMAGDVDATGWYGGQLVAIRWFQGRLVELLPMLNELVHSPTLSAVDNSYAAALAVAAATAGDRRTAAGALARLQGRDWADLPRSSSWLATMHGVVEAAHLLDDADTCAQAYDLLKPFAHLPVVASLGVACFGSVQHSLAVASLTTGHLDRAIEHFHEAINRNLALGHWPALRLSRLRYAQALTRRGRPHDAVAARDELAAVDDTLSQGIAQPGQNEPDPPQPSEASQLSVTCIREGRRWRFRSGSRNVLVEHSVGMLHLAVLLANPGFEIPAVELASGAAALGDAATRTSLSQQPTLDRVALQQYRHRLAQLQAEIDEMQSSNQPQRAERAREECNWLTAEIAAATGFGGRARRFPDSTERARIAVGKAIRRAIARIDEADPPIGEHLRRTVHTGVRCFYRPA